MAYQPKSLRKLILYGFGIVSLPLLLALAYAVVHMDRVAQKSQHAVYQAVQATTSSHQLLDRLTDMERTARQFLILEDEALLEDYAETHVETAEILRRLQRLPLEDGHRQQLNSFSVTELELYQQLQDGEVGSQEDLVQTFQNLNLLARRLLASSNRLVDREADAMRETAADARRMLLLTAATLPPLTVLLAILFAVLITRPVKQLDQAIHQLGDGRFGHEVAVGGPQDLQDLGRRLDWMRLRLKDLEEQKSRFLQHMSHELKTPLTAIREGAELLQDKVVGPLNAEQQEVALILQSNTLALQRLIEDMLNFGTSRGERRSLHLAHVQLAPLIDAVCRNHKPVMINRSLHLQTDLRDVRLEADEEKLRTIVDNLLSNAVKFSPSEGVIRVLTERHGNTVVIEVSDQGPGIPDSERESVFGAFFQGSHRASGYVKGSGLGLSIAKEYVDAHDGSIEALPGEGGGTRMRVILPLGQA
ncbi:ATP-binding protein [Methylonatrum kenyense]|uniref:HAMP domain-containing sensor histidine kinase n=1 Tax=Methylonatrum kenyense TaxID=455253 RepID=UPI0020C034E4|nr:ATP-binding protein [Methylonatrum kenyense]